MGSLPDTDYLNSLLQNNNQLSASTKEDIIALNNAARGQKDDCTVTNTPAGEGQATGSPGSGSVSIGGFQVAVNSNGVPTSIMEEGVAVHDVNSIVNGVGSESFSGCTAGSRRLLEITDEHLNENNPNHRGRKLGAWTSFQAWASGTAWCGAGTDQAATPCPVASGDNGDMACHRHDHGRQHKGIIGGAAVVLGCDI